MKVITYSISGEIQTPKTMTEDEIQVLREMAKRNEAFEIISIRELRIKSRARR